MGIDIRKASSEFKDYQICELLNRILAGTCNLEEDGLIKISDNELELLSNWVLFFDAGRVPYLLEGMLGVLICKGKTNPAKAFREITGRKIDTYYNAGWFILVKKN